MDSKYPKLNGVTLKPGVRVLCTDRDNRNWDSVGTIASASRNGSSWVFDVKFGQGYSRFQLGLHQVEPTFPNTDEATREAEAWKAGRAFRPFISYASEDKDAARAVHKMLMASAMRPWLDERDIPLGADWDKRIRHALNEAHVVLILISAKSIQKAGYFKREVKLALARAKDVSGKDQFIIPVRLEAVLVPRMLSKLQWVDWYEEQGPTLLMDTLRTMALSRQGG